MAPTNPIAATAAAPMNPVSRGAALGAAVDELPAAPVVAELGETLLLPVDVGVAPDPVVKLLLTDDVHTGIS